METKPPMPLTVQRVQWIDQPPNPRRRMDVLGYADAELIPYQIIRVPVPQAIPFGRALDRERIQEPPEPPRMTLWRFAVALVALILLGMYEGVVWFAERIRAIVRAL